MLHVDIIPTDDITYTSCFIAPDGTYYPVPYAGHYAFAYQVTGIEDDPVGLLERRGWVHVSLDYMYAGVFTGTFRLMGGGATRHEYNVTRAQQDVLMLMLMHAPEPERAVFVRSIMKYVGDIE
jgi:hypothetical protein